MCFTDETKYPKMSNLVMKSSIYIEGAKTFFFLLIKNLKKRKKKQGKEEVERRTKQRKEWKGSVHWYRDSFLKNKFAPSSDFRKGQNLSKRL